MAVNTQFQALEVETNFLAQYFLGKMERASEHFDRSEFLLDFDQLNYSDRVDLVLENLIKYNLIPNFATDSKNDILANGYKKNGDEHVQTGSFNLALTDYNNCLAMAKSPKVLSQAFFDRAKCLYNLGMRTQCLNDIERASKNCDSEEFILKLAELKTKALELQESAQKYYEKIPEIEPSHQNSKIQCASDNITIENIPNGRVITATRDIEIGEVIAVEKPYTVVVFPNHRTSYCHQCLNLCYDPIPCEKCTQAFYCSDRCKIKSIMYHRYECPTLFAVNEYTTNNTTLLLALRITFLALNDTFILNTFDFDDKTCYRSDRYNEIHYLKPQQEPKSLDFLHETVLTAFVYQLLWTKTSYFNSISSLWCHKEDFRNKFKEVLLQQLMSTKHNAVKLYDYAQKLDMYETDNFAFGIYSFFPLFNHSCCANVMKSYHGTALVLRALNTIGKGQQCYVNRYGLRYDAFPEPVRSHMLAVSRLPSCRCVACENDWKPDSGNLAQICEKLGIENMEFDRLVKRFIGADLDVANVYLPRLVSLLKECEKSEPSGNAVLLKRLIAHCYTIFGNKRWL